MIPALRKNEPTLIIAECGSCHDGDLSKALRLIEAAKTAGADVAKFQYWSSVDRLVERRHAEAYRAIYTRYQLTRERLEVLKLACDSAAIGFMCTCYLPEDVPVVAPLVDRFKIASFEAADRGFLRVHANYGKRVLISTGMIVDAEWRTWLRLLHSTRWDGIDVLHCVSAYPAETEQLNLATIRKYGLAGLSDHSDPRDTWTGALAVAAGARILEAHLKLDETNEDNPDAAHAMTPYQFAMYVHHVRHTERVLGDGVKTIAPCEQPMLAFRVSA